MENRKYKFITYWKLDVPPEEAWRLISDIVKWPEWWKGVLSVKVIHNGDERIRFDQIWQSFIPYKLNFITEVTAVEIYKTIHANVTGELEGTGQWEFIHEADGTTTIIYYWFVRTTPLWMNF